MGRPSKLTPIQWAEIERRAAEGESHSSLAREYGIGVSTVSARVSRVSVTVRKVATQVAEAHTALAALPMRQQVQAMTLAEKLQNISSSLASAAEHGAATAHRLAALANSEVAKIDDAAVLAPESLEAMKGVAALTKLSNEAAATGLNLLAANKKQGSDEPPDPAETTPVFNVTLTES